MLSLPSPSSFFLFPLLEKAKGAQCRKEEVKSKNTTTRKENSAKLCLKIRVRIASAPAGKPAGHPVSKVRPRPAPYSTSPARHVPAN